MTLPLYECHGHLMMDGEDYFQAKRRHQNGADIETVKEELRALQEAGVGYFRDGGDALGVSEAARALAPAYGIDYVTPLFALHKKGYYGGIVGHGYSELREYEDLVKKVREEEGDFIKIMISGIITFGEYGELSCPSLPAEEISELVRIAHAAGFAIMIHGNGDAAIRAAVQAGADSIEHGVFMEKETVEMLADSQTIWVPTAAAIAAFVGRKGFDSAVAEKTLARHLENIRLAAEKGAKIAVGSDSGTPGVPHGRGTIMEYELLKQAGVSEKAMENASRMIKNRFRKQEQQTAVKTDCSIQ